MSISYSAPAKVILSGEHGVVYGKPALVSAIDLRLTSIVSETTKQSSDDLTRFIAKTVLSYLKKKNLQHAEKNIKITFQSDIPRGRGLGSSAALSVSSVAACLHFFTGVTPSKELVNNIAYLIEKRFHANPSGVDVSASCFGGLIFYRKEFEFLKTISALNFKLPMQFEENLYLIDSGKSKESTKEMVQLLGKQFNSSPNIETNLIRMEKITKKMTLAIIQEDANLFAECIQKNEEILENLDLVSQSTKNLLEKLSTYGVGKITGAGGKKTGSGYIIFLSHNNNKLEKYLNSNRITFMKFKQNAQGVIKV